MSNYDWPYIRQRYESGETAYAISKRMGGKPTKQAIVKRAGKEGWEHDGTHGEMVAVAAELPLVKRALEVRNSEYRTAENIAIIGELIMGGATQELAGAAIGVGPQTISRWKSEDPEFARFLSRCRAGNLIGYVHVMHEAAHKGEWKAAQAMLQAAPETREQFGKDSQGTRLEVVVKIDRDTGVTIDGQSVRESEAA